MKKAFDTIGGKQSMITKDQLMVALQMLQIQCDEDIVAKLFTVLKREGYSGIDFNIFTKICGFFLACAQSVQRFASKPFNYQTMQLLACGFM